jgi:hypothetical protein
MAHVASIVLCFFLSLAIVALVLVWWGWKTIREWYQEWWAKIIIEVAQLLTVAVGLGLALVSPDEKPRWLPAAILGMFNFSLWKVVAIVGERKTKADLKEGVDDAAKARADANRASRESVRRTKLLTVLRDSVYVKRQRLLEHLRSLTSGGKNPSIRDADKGLLPKKHIDDLLRRLLLFLQQLQPTDSEQAQHQNFRVGFYVCSDGAMKPLYGIDRQDGSFPFSSFEKHGDRYRLDCARERAHVASCVREGMLIIVPDCVAAEKEGTFTFYNSQQRTYLRSLVVAPMVEVPMKDGTLTEAALAIDTDIPGWFREEDRDFIRLYLDEFAARLSLEMSILALVARRE